MNKLVIVTTNEVNRQCIDVSNELGGLTTQNGLTAWNPTQGKKATHETQDSKL